MDTSLDTKRIDAYRIAPEDMRALYGNLELGGVLGSLSTQFGFDETTQKAFINVIGDAILGFFPKGDVKQQLISQLKMNNESADIAINALGTFIEMIAGSAAIPEAQKDLKEKLELRPDEVQSPQTEGVIPEAPKDLKEKLELRPEEAQVSKGDGEAGVRPLTRDEVLRALAPARTMAGDIASLEKQSSTASDIPHVAPKAKP